MVRMLHLLSVLALVAAAGLLALCARGTRRDDPYTTVGAAPPIVERFKQAGRARAGNDRRQTPPLIQEAEAFAAYLNPSPQKRRDSSLRREEKSTTSTPVSEIRPANTTPKFKLHGISYHRSRPEKSIALVRQPDGTCRWVRQGTRLGHVVIAQVNSDSISYRDGNQMHWMALNLSQVSGELVCNGENNSTPEASDTLDRARPRPAPVRSMRRIPSGRVSAKTGVALRNM